jgi:hypothetical protein
MTAALERLTGSAAGKALIIFSWAFGTWLTLHYALGAI